VAGKPVKMRFPENVKEVGEIVGIMYRKKGDKKKIQMHAFDQLPKLYVSNDGTQIVVIGGKFKFTKRGFEG
jgi:hypothetical protein